MTIELFDFGRDCDLEFAFDFDRFSGLIFSFVDDSSLDASLKIAMII